MNGQPNQIPNMQMNQAQNMANFNNQQMMQQQQQQMQQMQQNMQNQAPQNEETTREQEQKQIYTYQSDWIIYALGFSWRETDDFRLAIGSLKEDLENEIRIIKLNENNEPDFVASTNFAHQFPATKLLWIPSKSTSNADLLATTSDFLRIWDVDSQTNRVNMK